MDLNIPDPFNHGIVRPNWVPVKTTWEKELAELYGFPPPTEVFELHRNSGNSTAYKVILDGTPFVIRFWGIRNVERVALLEVMRNYAVEHGLPGPATICTISGGLFCTLNGHKATLSPYVDGDYFTGSLDALKSAATLQARFHKVFKDFPLATQLGKGAPHLSIENEIDDILCEVKSHSEPFDTVAKAAIDEAESWASSIPELSEFLSQTGHFDWNPQNLLFQPDSENILALLDYDFASQAERALDVALGMHKFARIFGEKTEAKHDLDSNMLKRCQAYIEAYHEESNLSEAEINAIPYLLFRQARRNIYFILHRHYFLRDTASDYDLPKQHLLLREAVALQGIEA